jgi:glycosyltransferase involved in cell wall biosynthesis
MRILIIHRSFALVGGAERVITDKANYLANAGHQLMLVSYEQGQHPIPYELHTSIECKDLKCRFFTLSKYPPLKRVWHFIRLRSQFRKSLRDIVASFRADVVVMASDWQTLIDVVLAASGNVPVIAEFHNTYDYVMRNLDNSGSLLKQKLTKLYCWHNLKNLRRCARLVVLTNADETNWRRHFSNVDVIPNPVTAYPDLIDDIPKDNGRIIFVGRFNHEKRLDRLISAFNVIAEKYPEWHVDIFGEGNEKQKILDQIASLNLERRIVVHKPTKAIYDEYKRSELLVLCSEYEAYSLVLVEAMSCGVPCVSMDCPVGPREIIQDGVNGLLAKDGDVEDLATKIEWMITHEAERQMMGKKAREFASTRRLSVIMSRWLDVYSLSNCYFLTK